MRKISASLVSVFALLLLVGGGCGKAPAAAPQAAEKAPAAAPAAPAKKAPAPGEIAFDYPIQKGTLSNAGEYVLAVPKMWADKAFEDPNGATFIYYAAKMVQIGNDESKIETLSGESMTLPNSLIISLPASNAKAKKGDIVLTWWQSGSGMTRAIVVGGSETEPEVLYLDREYKATDKPEKLLPKSFAKMNSNWQAGATLACAPGSETELNRYQLTALSSSKALLMGWAGKMVSLDRADCAALPLVPAVKAGDSVFFPLYGKFSEGTVVNVNPAIGRVTVKYQFAGQDEEAMVPFGDVAAQLVR